MLLKAAVMGIVEVDRVPADLEHRPPDLAGRLLGMQGPHERSHRQGLRHRHPDRCDLCGHPVYWQRLSGTVTHLGSSRDARRFALNVLIGFLPAVVLGLLIGKMAKAHLFTPIIVASAFIVGGLIILWAERRPASAVRVHSVDDMTALDALKVGLVQCFAMIPRHQPARARPSSAAC